MSYRVRPGTPYITDDATGTLYALTTRPLEVQVIDESGARIWAAILGGDDPAETMTALFADADPEAVRAQTSEFVDELVALGLVEETDE